MEQVCPRCKTSSYHKPSLKLLVNVCGHHICESCVDAVFTRPTAPCPECGLALRRNLYRLQQFEDPTVEKEVDIRKKVLQDYNQTEEDFATLREYNDYLEEVESIVYNLTNGIDVERTKERMERYKKDHQVLIMKNREQQRRRERVHELQLREEQEEQELRNRRAQALQEEVARARQRERQSIIQELMMSDRPASEVVASHTAASVSLEQEAGLGGVASSVKKDLTQPTFHSQMGTAVFEATPTEEGEPYHYQALQEDVGGPGVPDTHELDSYGYLAHLRPVEAPHKGSGYVPEYACQRALQEAFSGLFLTPNAPPIPPHPPPAHPLSSPQYIH